MDVKQEFAAVNCRIKGEAYKRVLEARGRIWKPTSTELADMADGGESPFQRRQRKSIEYMGTSFRAFAEAVLKIGAA